MAPLSMRPCGPGPAPPAPPAAGVSRCHVRPQRCGPGCAPGRRGRASRAQLPPAPSAAPRRALHAAAAPSSPQPAAGPPLRTAGLRSLGLRLLPPPGAARAVQVTALPRKREAERRAPGFPGLLPAPSAARAGPRARDAPPRGTVRTAGRPCQGKGRPPLTWVPDPNWSPGRLQQDPLCLCFPRLLALSTARV